MKLKNEEVKEILKNALNEIRTSINDEITVKIHSSKHKTHKYYLCGEIIKHTIIEVEE